jgi:Lon protease-like protein
MKDFLPLFPLNLVAFPGERLNLHIFEPRYKQLFRECQENQITFGIPTYIDGKIMNLGTELRLEAIEKSYASGELDVKTFGIGIFRIDEFYSQAPNKLYAGADIERLTLNTEEKDPILNEKIYAFLKDLFGTLDIAIKKIPKDAQSFISYDIAHHVGFSVEQEYQLLSMETELERQSFIYNHLQNIVPVAKEMENLKERALLNGHFKKIIPPSI